ncbi:two-component system activity regulator YycH [Bacillus sp. REN10]|uniref:YycH family regulatory protein n=1 Tax=Bacillus sp. REN10 TaxID=2782541 RepID=UPI00193B0803|nr:two-component system activity regulator YycH [Bacillus sp. REN10]
MNYEQIKNVVLVVLVCTSIMLTLSIWNYKPNLETIEDDYIHEVSIGETREAVDLIKPTKLLFHDEDQHFGTTNEKEIDSVMEELQGWTFNEPKNISNALNEKEFEQLVYGMNKMELVFPTFIPFYTMNTIWSFKSREVPNAVFDRIVINRMHIKDKKTSVYFISTNERLVFESEVSSPTLSTFKKNYLNQSREWDIYVSKKLDENRQLFLPEGVPSLMRYKYYPDDIDTVKFKDALFTDPGIVKKGTKTDGEEYTDGSSLMRVSTKDKMILYVNPAKEMETGRGGSLHGLIDKSINFVNEHSGWTDQYRLFEAVPGSPQISYRLFINGQPVFNQEGMAEIVQIWGKEQIYKYVRPYFTLNISIPSEADEVELQDGLTAFNQVKQQPGFDVEMLEDMTVGYQLRHDVQTDKILVLEPAWFYKYDGSWKELLWDEEMGGNIHGLE